MKNFWGVFMLTHKEDYLFARNGGEVAMLLLDQLQQAATANDHKQNVILAPFSIQNVFALAFAGGRGETIYEITNFLRFVCIYPDKVGKHFQFVLDTYKNSEVLKIANKVYVQQGKQIKQDYQTALREFYCAEAESINFSQSEAAAASINAWVEDKTAGKITALASAAALGDSTRLLLISALHFKGQWAQRFDVSQTVADEFWISPDESVQVQYMHQTAKFGYENFEKLLGCTALEMPYKDSDLSMLVLLPNERDGLKALMEKLRDPYVHLIDLGKKMTSVEEVEVKFPKFKVEFEQELSDAMQRIGIKTMFSSAAEFDNMLESPENICVSKVFHKAIIEVNEEGTEAAAATGMSMMNYSMRIPQQFQADHPFFYVIWNKRNVLFAGTFVNAPTTG